MLTSFGYLDIAAGETSDLPSAFPRHTTLGVDEDFDASTYPVVRIRIPRDGVYSVSARAWVTGWASGDDSGVTDGHQSVVLGVSTGTGDIDLDERPLAEHTLGMSTAAATLHTSHAGFPLEAAATIWAWVTNRTTHEATVNLKHLSVTYEAELGTVYSKGG